MKYGLYSIKDAKTGFMAPVLEQGDSVALRNFASAVNQSESLIRQFPNDFSFYKVAIFDTDSGIVPIPEPILVVDAAQVIRNEK